MANDDLWSDEQVERSKRNVARLADMASKMRALPPDKEESRKIIRSETVATSKSLARDLAIEELTEVQAAAAIMLGRGLLYTETAEALEIDEMDIHDWNTTNSVFKMWRRYFRSVTQEEQFGYAMRELEALATRSGDDKTLAKLIDLRLKIADKPEERELADRDHALKERAVLARESEVGRAIERTFNLPPGQVISAEFEVIEDPETDPEDEKTEENTPKL